MELGAAVLEAQDVRVDMDTAQNDVEVEQAKAQLV